MNAQAPTLAPLTLPDPEQREALRALLQPFFGAKALESVDVHVADQLGRLAGEGDPEVLLALAFAVRAPRHGHIDPGIDGSGVVVGWRGRCSGAVATRNGYGAAYQSPAE